MHTLTCVKYGAAALALGPAFSVTVPRGAASEYRICVSIIISAYEQVAYKVTVCAMNINYLQEACIFISADPRPTNSVQGLRGSMVVVLSS